MATDPTEALEARVAQLEALVEQLTAGSGPPPQPSERVAVVPAPPPAEVATPTEPSPALVDRRRLLSRGGAAAVGAALGGVAATIATAGPAAAATASFDTDTTTAALTATSTTTANIGVPNDGAAIAATSTGKSVILATMTGPGRAVRVYNSNPDLNGFSTGVESVLAGGGIGVLGEVARGYGVLGYGENGAVGVAAHSDTGPALAVDATTGSHISFGGLDKIAPRTANRAFFAREVYADKFNDLWLCVADGTPGTWVRIAGPGGAGMFSALPTPVRLYDTRSGSTHPGSGTGPISGTRHGIDLTANASGLPADATAAMVTMTVTNTQANPAAYGQIYPDALTTPPATSVINWTQANDVIATTTTAGLTAGKVAVTIAPGANVILDLIGYWR